MSITVRRATLADVNETARLFNGYRMFYEQASDFALASAYLTERMNKNESVIFIAENDDDTCSGFTQLYPSFSSVAAQRVWVLNDLYVDKAARHQGVGRSLMNKAREFAAETDAKRIELETRNSNVNAQALYESLGYEVDTSGLYYSLELS